MTWKTPTLLAAVLLTSGCALLHRPPAPAPAPAPLPASMAAPAARPPAPIPPPPPPVPLSRLICTVQEARRVSFADLGVPAGSRPLDVALGKSTVWVLFEPSLLVAVPRTAAPKEAAAVAEYGEVEETEMIPGPRPDAWRRLTEDPGDGTLWIASPSGLWRRLPGRRPEAVAVTRPLTAADAGMKAGVKSRPRERRGRKKAAKPPEPLGEVVPVPGGFRGVLASHGTVWAAPVCAADALLRLDSRGRLLGTALPAPASGTADSPARCAPVDLERDGRGDLWALRPASGEVFRLAFDGSWKPAPDLVVPLPATPPAGEPLRAWFFWGMEPVALGGGEAAAETRLFRRIDGRVTAFREDCGEGNALVRVAGDAGGWAALTRDWLLLGEYRQEKSPESPGKPGHPAPGSD